MEWHRVKNVILAILMIVNGMLLLVVWNRKTETQRYEQSALNGAVQILAENGIELSSQGLENLQARQPGSARRSREAEAALACVLLGETVEGENRGGGLYTYSTALGELSFRPGGVLSAELADVPFWHTEDPETHAAVLMEELDVECRRVRSDLDSGSGTVRFVQWLDGVPVFSCQVVLTYEEGRLCRISGNLLPLAVLEMESGEPLLSLPTVLMRFLEDVLDSGDVCSEILSVRSGYLVTHSVSDTIQLRPTWHISTNTADYYVDGLNGAVTRTAAE